MKIKLTALAASAAFIGVVLAYADEIDGQQASVLMRGTCEEIRIPVAIYTEELAEDVRVWLRGECGVMS